MSRHSCQALFSTLYHDNLPEAIALLSNSASDLGQATPLLGLRLTGAPRRRFLARNAVGWHGNCMALLPSALPSFRPMGGWLRANGDFAMVYIGSILEGHSPWP